MLVVYKKYETPTYRTATEALFDKLSCVVVISLCSLLFPFCVPMCSSVIRSYRTQMVADKRTHTKMLCEIVTGKLQTSQLHTVHFKVNENYEYYALIFIYKFNF